MKKTFLSLLLTFSSFFVYAGTPPLELVSSDIEYPYVPYALFWCDMNADYKGIPTEDSIVFNPTPYLDYGQLTDSDHALWCRVDIVNKNPDNQKWVFEFYDFRPDTIELFVFDTSGTLMMHGFSGDATNFNSRMVKHKNPAFEINIAYQQQVRIYYRIRSDMPVKANGVVRTYNRFLHYATVEYFMLAIFYGIIAALALYNVILFFQVNNSYYLAFVNYLITLGLYTLARDGLGFEFLWPNLPIINNYMLYITNCAMVITLMMFARVFLGIAQFPLLNTVYWGAFIFRILWLVVGFTMLPTLLDMIWVDAVNFLFIAVSAYFIYKQGFKAARYFVVGIIIFVAGFITTSVCFAGLLPGVPVYVYAQYAGLLIEIILFSVAISDRFRVIIEENELAQKEIIFRLQENERIKEEANRVLEERVMERTQALQQKNKELDSFIYKASHDIKGPLRSIIGLAKLGAIDPGNAEYFEHILKSGERLDSILEGLLQSTRIKQSESKPEAVNVSTCVKEIISSFSFHPDYEKITFNTLIDIDGAIWVDKNIFISMIQNFVENGIKYFDPEKPSPFFSISARIKNHALEMIFEDNGKGIAPEHLEKIYDMFYKVDEKSMGSGLGLHIVKTGVEKLGGKISIISTQHIGTTFTVSIPLPKDVLV